jgi:hypothetical protein
MICLVGLSLLAGLFLAGTGRAAEPPAFGYTNVAQAVILHPLMGSFDAQAGRFLRTAVPAGLAAKTPVGDQIAARRKKIQDEISECEKEIGRLEKEYFEKLGQLGDPPQGDSTATPSPSSLYEYNKKRQSLENDFRQRVIVQKTKRQRKEIEQEGLDREARQAHLASHDETNRVFKLILDDISEAIDEVTRHYKIQFVFNSSFSIDRGPRRDLAPSENPMGEVYAIGEKAAADAEAVRVLFGRIQAWTQGRNWLTMNCGDPRLDRFVLRGGVDMTPAVVDLVLQKHNIGKTQRDLLQTFFKTLATEQ